MVSLLVALVGLVGCSDFTVDTPALSAPPPSEVVALDRSRFAHLIGASRPYPPPGQDVDDLINMVDLSEQWNCSARGAIETLIDWGQAAFYIRGFTERVNPPACIDKTCPVNPAAIYVNRELSSMVAASLPSGFCSEED